MSCPIAIMKNNKLYFEAENIQEAARFLAEEQNTTKYKYYDHIERGYVYNIPFYIEEDEYQFIASEKDAMNRRKQLEERNHKNARRIWLVPANPNDYDVEGAFSLYDTIDWKRSFNYENGDIIFFYLSGNIRRVRFKAEVVQGLVTNSEYTDDKRFWLDEEKYELSKEYYHSRIRLIDEVDTSELSLGNLREHGLKSKMQGSMKLSGELREYIISFFEQDLTDGYYPEEVPETLEEGKCKTISVNVYERNPIARKKCIDRYGSKCKVCDFDFKDKYGEVGKDFIHVHHIIPLHEIKQDYIVDPIKDLIPVCPNCHAMLHRKENGVYLSVEQLKKRISFINK